MRESWGAACEFPVTPAAREGIVLDMTWLAIFGHLAKHPRVFVMGGRLGWLDFDFTFRPFTREDAEQILSNNFVPKIPLLPAETKALVDRLALLDAEIKQREAQLANYRAAGNEIKAAREDKLLKAANAKHSKLLADYEASLSPGGEWSRELFRTLTRRLLSLGDHTPVRKLTRIAFTPVFHADGRLHVTPGFDSETGVFLVASALLDSFTPKALERRLRRCGGDWQVLAQRSARILLRTIATMPGGPTAANRAGWLCLLLTVLLRATYPNAPIHAVTANRPRIGKTVAAMAANHVSELGHPTSAILFDRSVDGELDKLIRQRFLTEEPGVVFVDNHRGQHFGSPMIEAAVTMKGPFDVRPLGRSDCTKKVANGWTIVVTANNPSYATDTLKRCLVIDFEFEGEDPSRLKFDRPDPLAWARRYERKLITHLLLLALAHREAGYPQPKMESFNSFEEWQSRVQAAVMWATGIDPRAGIRDLLHEEDENDAMVLRWVTALRAAGATSRDKAIKLSDLIRKVALPEVRAAVETAPRKSDGRVNESVLGLLLKEVSRTTVDGQRICRRTRDGYRLIWAESTSTDHPEN